MNEFDNSDIVDPTVPHGFAETMNDIKRLLARYPDMLSVKYCGRSRLGRAIPVLKLGRGQRNILTTASIHAREFVTTGFLLKNIEDILKSHAHGGGFFGYDPEKFLSEFSVYAVVLANPDGVEISLGRQPSDFVPREHALSFKNNAANVNLNANFPFEWHRVPSVRQGGSSAGSEPETKLLIRLCERLRFELMLSFHSRGNCLYWRDAKNGTVPYDRAVAEDLRAVCGYELCRVSRDAESFSGGFENWFRHRFMRAGICVELVTDENADFLESCRSFNSLTNYEKTRLTLLSSANVLCDFQLFIA